MRECDAKAVAIVGGDALVQAAGGAVAAEARKLLGGCYGKRICVVAGPGLNGADGRVAATLLRGRGAKVDLIAVNEQPRALSGFDLVIDAAFGLGCSRPYDAPSVTPGTLVLAVDLPSGVDADTGAVLGHPLVADVTLALGALKYAHVDGDATALVGEIRYAGLGIEAPSDDALIVDADLQDFVVHGRDDHKWTHAVSHRLRLCRRPECGSVHGPPAKSWQDREVGAPTSRGRALHWTTRRPPKPQRGRRSGLGARIIAVVKRSPHGYRHVGGARRRRPRE